MKERIALLLVILFAFFLLFSALSVAEAGNVFKIGNIQPLSGPAAPWGIESTNGLSMVVEDINAEGGFTVKGEKYDLKVISYDSKYNPTEAINAMQRLIAKDKVEYVFTLGTSPTIAIIPMAQKHKVALFTASGGGRKVNNKDNYYVFNIMQGGPMACIVFLKRITDLGVKRLALINPNDDTGKEAVMYTRKVIKEFALPIEIVADEYFTRGAMDFTPVLIRALGKKPEWVDFTAGSAGDTGLALKQLRELGYTGPTSTCMAYVRPDVIWKIAGDAGVGHITHRFWAEPPTKEWEEMAKRYKAKYKEDMGPLVVEYYDVVKVLVNTIKREGTFDTTKVVDALSKATFDSAYGKNIRWGGSQKIFGYGLDRQILIPSPFSKVLKGGSAEMWYSGMPL